MEQILAILIIAFGTYGLAVLLTSYDGPFGILYKLRDSTRSKLVTCSMCAGFWISAAVAIILQVDPTLWLAGYGVFALMEHR